jgi:hypothetical protein
LVLGSSPSGGTGTRSPAERRVSSFWDRAGIAWCRASAHGPVRRRHGTPRTRIRPQEG